MFDFKRKLAAFVLLQELESSNKRLRAATSPEFVARNKEGAYISYFLKYCKEDPTKFRKFLRLSEEQFHYVLNYIKADILIEPTNRYPEPISPEHQLAVTLRYVFEV